MFQRRDGSRTGAPLHAVRALLLALALIGAAGLIVHPAAAHGGGAPVDQVSVAGTGTVVATDDANAVAPAAAGSYCTVHANCAAGGAILGPGIAYLEATAAWHPRTTAARTDGAAKPLDHPPKPSDAI